MPKRLRVAIVAGTALLLVGYGLLWMLALWTPGDNQAKAAWASWTQPGPTRTPEEAAQAALEQAARVFTGDHKRVTLERGIGRVTYDTSMAPWVDESRLVSMVAYDFTRFAPESMQIAAVQRVEVTARASFTSVRGNNAMDTAVALALTRDGSAKVDWGNFNDRNLARILTGSDGSFYVHPALAAAWREYEAGK